MKKWEGVIRIKNNFFRKVKTLYIYIIAQIRYKMRFGKLGWRAHIIKPLLLLNPRNIYCSDCVRIYKNSRIETIEKWNDQHFQPSIYIGEKTSFEQNLHMTCANSIIIGKENVFSANVLVTDINHEYRNIHTNVMLQDISVQSVKIGDYCFIGMGAKIMPGSVIGNNCIIGANTMVMGEIPDYSVAVGMPARVIKKYSFETEKWEKV